MEALKKYLFLSQALLCISLVTCCLIIPSVVTKEGGFSNFGNHLSTVWLYSFGFITNIVYIYLASQEILKISAKLQGLSRALAILSFLTLVVFISTFPRHYGFTFSQIHDYLGILLFTYELILAIYLIAQRFSYQALSLLIVMVAGSLIGLLSITKIIDYLLVGQLIASLGFALILVTLLPKVVEEVRAEKPVRHLTLK